MLFRIGIFSGPSARGIPQPLRMGRCTTVNPILDSVSALMRVPPRTLTVSFISSGQSLSLTSHQTQCFPFE